MSCLHMHGTNTGTLNLYKGDVKVNGTSMVSGLANTVNAKNVFFNVSTEYGGTTFYGDGSHDDQPAIMAAICCL